MTKLSITLLAVVSIASVGCKKKEGDTSGGGSAAAGSGAGSATAGSATGSAATGSGLAAAGSSTVAAGSAAAGTTSTNVAGKVADKDVVFNQAFVTVENGTAIAIKLYAEPATCDTGYRDAAHRVFIKVPAGPDGKHYSGRTLAPDASISIGKGDEYRDYPVGLLSTLKLGEFELKKGSRVKGHLEVDQKRSKIAFKLSGDFDAEICSLPASPKTPPAVATTPAAGKAEKAKFESKSALLKLGNDSDNDLEYADTLYLFSKPGVKCDADRSNAAATGDVVDLHQFGGVNARNKMTGVPLSAWATIRIKGDKAALQAANAWVQFDEVSFESNGTAKGTMMVQNDNSVDPNLGYSISGTFTAIVCK